MTGKKTVIKTAYRPNIKTQKSEYPFFKNIFKLFFQFSLSIVFLLILSLIKIGQMPVLSARLAVKILKWFAPRIIKIFYKLAERVISVFSIKQTTLPLNKFQLNTVYQKQILPQRKFYQTTAFKLLGLVFVAFLIFYSIALLRIAKELPSPDRLSTIQSPLTTQIYDRNGKLLYQIYEGRNRQLIALDQLPKNLVNATIAIEDKNFYYHHGVDFSGIARAIKSNIEDKTTQGGSTITQQLIKNTLLTPDQTYSRKIKEILLSLWTENIYSKEQILTMYFNEVPYGGPAWGIEAASEMYFGKSATNLDLAESAYLAGLPAAPTAYSPYGPSPEKGKQRQSEVLGQMVKLGNITQQEADQAANQELQLKPALIGIKAPHFVMYVRSLLEGMYGSRTVSQGGLKVVTSLDLSAQEMTEKVVADQVANLSKLKVSNGAAMVMDAQSGQILAMVGSKNYYDSQGGNYNVTLSLRQPGSSIKPVTYATAFKTGYSPGTVLLDAPTTFPNPWGKPYKPVNYDGKFHGLVSARTALGSSYNIPAVKMLATVGIPNMVQTAQDMGITTFDTPDNYGLAITLGGVAVRMIDMMSVYDTFASGGVRYQPTAILKVTDSSGNVLLDNQYPEGERVLSAEVAYLINNVLSDNQARTPVFGPNSLLKIDNKTVAVKTGTSDDKRDNWVFGYTPKIVVGTWVGNNDNTPMNPQLASGITGATPMWHDIMLNLVKDSPDLAFTRPAGIIEVNHGNRKELAISGTKPKDVAISKVVKETSVDDGQVKEIVTYSDPFTFSFTPDLLKQANN